MAMGAEVFDEHDSKIAKSKARQESRESYTRPGVDKADEAKKARTTSRQKSKQPKRVSGKTRARGDISFSSASAPNAEIGSRSRSRRGSFGARAGHLMSSGNLAEQTQLVLKQLQLAKRLQGIRECVGHLVLSEEGLELEEMVDLIRLYPRQRAGNRHQEHRMEESDVLKIIEALDKAVELKDGRYRLLTEDKEVLEGLAHSSAVHRWITTIRHYSYFSALAEDALTEHRCTMELSNLERLVKWGILSEPNASSMCTNLNFCSSALLDEDIAILCKELSTNTRILSLNISTNRIKSPGAKSVAKLLEKNTPLLELLIGSNEIGDGGSRELASGLIVNTTLSTLKLQSSGIGDQGCEALCEALLKNRSVSILDLSDNPIGEEGVETVMRLLRVNSSIVEVNLHGIKP